MKNRKNNLGYGKLSKIRKGKVIFSPHYRERGFRHWFRKAKAMRIPHKYWSDINVFANPNK